MKRYAIAILIFITTSFSLRAQNEVDALRYSQYNFGGTARYMSMGGAFGALGADVSTLSTNPAGLGLYKSSEFTFSPSVTHNQTSSNYFNSNREDNKTLFNFSNLGYVSVIPMRDRLNKNKWKGFQFGLALNRLNNFNKRVLISGTNPINSLLDAYLNFANGSHPDDLNVYDTKMAYETYLIDPYQDASGIWHYTNKAPYHLENGQVIIDPVDQVKTLTTSGRHNEIAIAFGGNYNDQLYLGGSIGIPYLRYEQNSRYEEFNNVTNDTNTFDRFALNENLVTEGTGINAKFGLIYRPLNWLRLGAAVHTPTYYYMSDEWSKTMSSTLNNGKAYYHPSPVGTYEYNLKTPMRLLGSAAIIVGKKGLISIDYERVNYTNAHLNADDYSFEIENQNTENFYQPANNIRIGTEWRLSPLSLRAGYAYYGSPYTDDLNDGARSSFSFGLGFRQRNYFVDLAYVHTISQEDYYLYASETVSTPPATLDDSSNNFILTLGFRF